MLAHDLFVTDLIPTTLDKILKGDLRPWLKSGLSENYYHLQLESLTKLEPDYPFRFDFKFPRPFNEKTNFYNRLIRNQVILEVPRLINLIREEEDEFLFRHRLRFTLHQCLEPRMVKVGQVLKDKGYFPFLLHYSPEIITVYTELVANAFATRMLGRAYAKIYLEVQEAFSDWIDDKLEPEDLYARFIKEPTEDAPIHRIFIPADGFNALNRQERKGKTKKTGDQVSTDSFTYLGYHSAPKKLEDAFNSLKNSGLIAGDTTKADFERIFSGKVVENPVRWTGYTSDLYYFITQVHSKQKLILPLGKEIWAVTCKCFVRKDGTRFKRGSFRQLHHPLTHKASIDMAVKHLM
jgi:hypothetical protein